MFEFDPRKEQINESKVKVVAGVNALFDGWAELNIAMAEVEETARFCRDFDPYLEQCLMRVVAEKEQFAGLMSEVSYRMDQLRQKGMI